MTTATVIKQMAYFKDGVSFGTLKIGDILEGVQERATFRFSMLTVAENGNVRTGNFTCFSSPMYLRIASAPDPDPEPQPIPDHVVEVFIDGESVFRKELF